MTLRSPSSNSEQVDDTPHTGMHRTIARVLFKFSNADNDEFNSATLDAYRMIKKGKDRCSVFFFTTTITIVMITIMVQTIKLNIKSRSKMVVVVP